MKIIAVKFNNRGYVWERSILKTNDNAPVSHIECLLSSQFPFVVDL